MRHTRRLLILLSLSLTACGQGVPAHSTATGRAPDPRGSWQLADGRVDGEQLPQPPGSQVTMVVEDTTLRGLAFCNYYDASYRLRDGVLTVEDVRQSAMGCDLDRLRADDAFVHALANRAMTVRVDTGELHLRGDGVELRFTPQAVDQRSLVPSTPAAG